MQVFCFINLGFICFCLVVTVHEEFSERVLAEIKRYFNVDGDVIKMEDKEVIVYKQPIVCPDKCKRVTDCDRLENLVDVDDGYLMKAFQPFLTETKFVETTDKPTLYEELAIVCFVLL